MDVGKRIVTFQITLLPLNMKPQTDVNTNFYHINSKTYEFYYYGCDTYVSHNVRAEHHSIVSFGMDERQTIEQWIFTVYTVSICF